MTFCRLFPDVNPINKIHHIQHYPDCIVWSGPLSLYNCVRFEAKHAEIKLRAQNIHNFKNPTKSLIRISQCIQSSKWGANDVEVNRFKVISGSLKLVENLQRRDDLLALAYFDHDQVFCAKSVTVNGTEYRLNLYVCLEAYSSENDNLPVFALIKEIIILQEKEVFLKVSVCLTTYFDTNLNAFCVDSNNDESPQMFTHVFHLAYYKPFCCWTKLGSDELFISLRHML